MRKISQIFVALSEKLNFKFSKLMCTLQFFIGNWKFKFFLIQNKYECNVLSPWHLYCPVEFLFKFFARRLVSKKNNFWKLLTFRFPTIASAAVFGCLAGILEHFADLKPFLIAVGEPQIITCLKMMEVGLK